MVLKISEQNIRVVIIEDDPDDILIVKDLLKDLPMIKTELTIFQTYQQGWEEIAKDRADVYLIDQHLGAQRGVSLIARARDRGIQKPMILLTGNDSPEVDYEAQEAGASDYVYKGDLKPSILARAIRYSLAQWQALQSRERFVQERVARLHAQDLERRKTEFLRIASHELKTPITSTFSNLYLLREAIAEKNLDKAEEYSERSYRQLKHLTAMMEDLLDLSKIEMERMTYSPEIINLTSLVAGVIESMQSLTSHQIKLSKPDDDVFIQADPARVNQVMTNLVANAAKFSPKAQEIIVEIKPKKEVVEVSVRDFGIGIKQSEIMKVFDKFYSTKQSDSKQQSGLGLGLYLAKHIVERHGGSITVSSEPGSGTIFLVKLPYEQN